MRFFHSLLAIVCLTTSAMSQDTVPQSRFVVTPDVDFVGSDLANIFDTTNDACAAACANTNGCVAYTFNQRSNACFPKSSLTDVLPYEGAISARLYPTNAKVLGQADARTAELNFLSNGDLAAAGDFAREIGRSRTENTGGLRNLGAAIAETDRAGDWLTYAELARTTPDNNVKGRALPAAINAYLRSFEPQPRIAALREMAVILEGRDRGRLTIPALQLAQQIASTRDGASLLEDAIAKFGFRVTDTQVEADSATPRVCAIFNEPLAATGVDYTPYVQLPDQTLVVQAQDGQLCIDGVTHGTRYQITLRDGLPAASGETLAKTTPLTFYVRDRSPSVRFTSRAYVLPRLGEVAIPVETVNLAEVSLTMRRLSDRSIIRAMQEQLFNNPLYAYNADFLDDNFGAVIWEGTGETQVTLNADTLTRLSMTDALNDQPPGLYVLSASVPGADPYDAPPATQWFVLSDLGIATYLGTDGLTVAVRGLGDAEPVGGATVTLLSEGNDVLATATADPAGIAQFAPGLTRGRGVNAPALVTVENGTDMAFVSLRDAAFDLSDRGVEGREPAGPMDVFMTTDRGAYRAGEVIHVTALMRDANVRTLQNAPLTAILTRPDGVEYSRTLSQADMAGGHVFALPVAGTAPRGTWAVALKADVDAPALASTSVLVEDFLPERIDFDLTLPDVIRASDTPPLGITAKYLFGPPAADLAVEGEARLRPATTLDAFPGYRFGRYDEPVQAQTRYIEASKTQADGTAQLFVQMPELNAAQPLELRVTARVSEGSGRPVERQITATVQPDQDFIGIKPLFDGVVAEGGDARFDIIALNPALDPTAMEVTWALNRVNTRYQWYSVDGDWQWEPVTTRERVATGDASLNGTTQVGAPVAWGRYELVIEDRSNAAISAATDFYAGWYAPAAIAGTPDVLQASLDAENYAIGDTATLRIVPRYAGTAVVTVMSNRLIAMETYPVTAGENLISLPVTDEWGAGAYVSATVIRPMDVAAGRNPARALGIGYGAVAPGDKALGVTLDVPTAAQPRAAMTVGVQVDGVAAGDTAYVTLAAVDVGILNITGFQSPDPQGHYFGQRKLGVEMRDLYGRLIDGLTGDLGQTRSGGDAMAQVGMQSPPPTEDLVTYFTGPVQIGADGTAQIRFDLPAFNGTLKLMAVAWSDTGVGQADAEVLVRDPVVVTASVPRFMAPGDQSRLLLEIVHADGPAGTFGLNVAANGLALATVPPAQITLAQGGKQTFSIPFAAFDAGVHSVDIGVTLPDGRTLTKTLTVPVVINDPEVSRISRFTLAAGETFRFDSDVFAGLTTGSGHATLSVGPLARFDAPGLLSTLDRYPYGCTEQITSRALPLLYLSGVADAMDLGSKADLDSRIKDSIAEVLANQSANGAFGLWRAASGDMWLDAYVTDFLSRARIEGHTVPDLAFTNAVDNLRNRVNYYPDFDEGGEDLAYALMILAREGAATVGDLRYYADEKAGALSTPLAKAQLGAALAFYGDQRRADGLFVAAGQALALSFATPEPTVWRSDFGTNRRDTAAVLALAVEAGSTAIDVNTLTLAVAQSTAHPSTQEAAWTLLAANALIKDVRSAGITIDGRTPDGPVVQVLSDDASTPIAVANGSGSATEITVTTFGVPSTPEPAGGNGYAIDRAYFTTDGAPVDPAQISTGTRLVTVLTVTPFGRQEARLMVNNPLPAGFEIDNPNLLRGGDIRALEWLNPIRGENAEFRTDRFLAAVDWRSDDAFQLAYIVRAVSPGNFHHPAASVEDMYRPQMRARTGTNWVVIAE